GKKRKLMTGCGSLHCTAFFDPETGELVEAYLNKGSTGGCNNFMVGLSRMISLAARSGCGVDAIIDQLKSCGSCPSYVVRTHTKRDTSIGSCCPMAVGWALRDMYDEMQSQLKGIPEAKEPEAPSRTIKNPCPKCGAELEFQGGCNTCKSCGWSKCD
ncbi:MAG: ribonucleoside-diphosphate reductase, adenosylcobalamin-dependent, partial [Candidatus Methanomethylophilaceae archaeon]|nr:ribonucleoside-diphosphate reductase, adenosylcobalamin-dependent [Candidatus Methanomethylophilaceae archaeon]